MQEEGILGLYAYGEWLPRFMADTGTAWKNMEPEDVPEWFDQVGCHVQIQRSRFQAVSLLLAELCAIALLLQVTAWASLAFPSLASIIHAHVRTRR